MKRIAVLTSGRDVSGSNAAIRSVVRSAIGKGMQVFGINNGFRGLYEDHFEQLSSRSVSGRIGKASSFIGTSHSFEFIEESKIQRILANLNKRSIEGLVIIGGSGSFALSQRLAKRGVPIVGIPATIQDDIVGTDICLGVDSAINNIMKSIDHIRSCDSSRNRSFLVGVEGRYSGSLALRAAIVSGAEACLIPERPAEDLAKIAQSMAEQINNGKTQCIAIVAAGWKPGIEDLSNFLEQHENETDLLVRKTVLGYVQRGGSPSGFDRLLGTNFGAKAVEMLAEGAHGNFIAYQGSRYERVPFSETIDRWRTASEARINLFEGVTN